MRIGIYNRHLATLGGGERYSLAIASLLAPANDVEVISHTAVDPAQIATRLHLPLDRVRYRVVPAQPAADLGPLSAEYDFFINASNGDFITPAAPHSALVVFFPAHPGGRITRSVRARGNALLRRLLALAPDAQPTSLQQRLTDRLVALSPELDARLRNPQPADLRAVAARYDLRWAISRFTQQWIQRYWALPGSLLYPAVDVENFVALPKEPWILSVGRFFAGQHNKQHLAMVRTFGELVDEGFSGWHLHLAGGVTPGAVHSAYLEEVRQAAAGYPITVHADLSFAALRELYGRSAIYWHAAGYGEDEMAAPVKFEHFGITTVEAMAAGCVPVVIGAGGQRELVQPGVSGYLWRTAAELKSSTRRLVARPELATELSKAAMRAGRRFDWPHFRQQLVVSLAAAGIPAEVAGP